MKIGRGTVLVCGAGGFIGSHMVAHLSREGWNVVGTSRSIGEYAAPLIQSANATYFSGDLSLPDFTQAVLRKVNPDVIVFAAGPADVASSFLDPIKDLKSQVIPFSEVLSACCQLERKPKVLLLSSAAVYGNPVVLPILESFRTEPISPYGYHKLLQERLLIEFLNLYELPCAIARIFSIYGEGFRRLAVWDITRRAMKGDYTVRGCGDESRDYLYIDDLMNALTRILINSPFRGEIINVASGKELQIRKLADCIFAALGHNVKANFDGEQMRGNPIRWKANIDKLADFGFKPSIDLFSGIERTVHWIKRDA